MVVGLLLLTRRSFVGPRGIESGNYVNSSERYNYMVELFTAHLANRKCGEMGQVCCGIIYLFTVFSVVMLLVYS